jgi:predicted GTPase
VGRAAVATVAWPLICSAITSGACSRSFARKARPSMSGITTSDSTASTGSSASRSSARGAEEAVTAVHPPASPGRRHVRILYAAQTGVAPPTFVFFTNVATEFHFSYERFLANRLRDSFGMFGTPIRIQVRKR